jgi:ABC-2 type transport system ATP-binding protein
MFRLYANHMRSPSVITKKLTLRYGTKSAVNGLDLTIASGEIFGLLGHNGAGKTTIVSMLTTLLEPSSGSATVDGFNIARDAYQVRRTIGYLPENVQFYDNLTLYENLEFFARLSGLVNPKKRIHQVLEFL